MARHRSIGACRCAVRACPTRRPSARWGSAGRAHQPGSGPGRPGRPPSIGRDARTAPLAQGSQAGSKPPQLVQPDVAKSSFPPSRLLRTGARGHYDAAMGDANDKPSPVIFIDADACPVKDEVYKVAARYGLQVRGGERLHQLPVRPRISRVVVETGPDAADDWIADHAAAWHIAMTNDIPLAERVLQAGAAALCPDGRPFTGIRSARRSHSGDHGATSLHRRGDRRAQTLRPPRPLAVPSGAGSSRQPGAAWTAMIPVTDNLAIDEEEIGFTFIRASGPAVRTSTRSPPPPSSASTRRARHPCPSR